MIIEFFYSIRQHHSRPRLNNVNFIVKSRSVEPTAIIMFICNHTQRNLPSVAFSKKPYDVFKSMTHDKILTK